MNPCVLCDQKPTYHGLIVNGKTVCLNCARRIAKVLGAAGGMGAALATDEA